ncbi:MAG: transcriptional regulator NrdR [Myxococcota bacterium]
MRCPFCDHPDTKVIDARNQRDAPVKRRRRECSECGRRFTTYERIEDLLPMVVKRDGRREAFDRLKIIGGLQRACEKRPVSADAIEETVQRVERAILDLGEREVSSKSIGDEAQLELRALDPVAWLRFSSVYLGFRTIEEFRDALDEIDPARGG